MIIMKYFKIWYIKKILKYWFNFINEYDSIILC